MNTIHIFLCTRLGTYDGNIISYMTLILSFNMDKNRLLKQIPQSMAEIRNFTLKKRIYCIALASNLLLPLSLFVSESRITDQNINIILSDPL